MLAPEDESLFVIWAKNKNLVTCTETSQLQKDSGPDAITASRENISAQPEFLQEDPVFDVDSASKAPNSSVAFAPSTSTHGVSNTRINNTPQKTATSVIMPVGIEIPSPFKRALLWPEPDTKKRRTKEQFPSAITGEAWRAIMAKKEVKKKQKE